MTNIRQKIFVGARTPGDIDGIIVVPQTPPFMADRNDITMDTTTRRADEIIL